jgi:hypothetical protein
MSRSAVEKKGFLAFRLTPELKKEIEDIARREQRSVPQICEFLLREVSTLTAKDAPNTCSDC